MAFLDENAIFRPHIELEAIARQSVEASREVICAYFGNMGSHPSVHGWRQRVLKSKVVC